MKKFFVFLLTIVLIFTPVFSIARVSAHTIPLETTIETNKKIVSETTQYFEDGSYITTIVTQNPCLITRSSAYTLSGAKTSVCYNSNNEELFRFTVYGTFSVNSGISATCTEASCSSSITDNEWSETFSSASAIKNQAIGNATFTQVKKDVIIGTQKCHIVLSCDKNGKLS